MNRFERRGATVVEFALTLPILLLVVFGGVELTRMSMLRHTANHTAYIAARAGIVPGADVADVITKAERHLQAIGIRNAVVSISPSTILEDTSLVEVSVTFPVAENSLVVPEFVSGNVLGQCAMVTERSKAMMSVNLPAPPPPPPPPVSPEDDDDDDDDDDSSSFTPVTPPPSSPPSTPAPPSPPPPML